MSTSAAISHHVRSGRFHRVSSLAALLLAGLALFLGGCADETVVNPSHGNPAGQFNAEVPTAWFDLHLKLIATTPGFTPPVASRAIGYAGVAMYEAIVPGMTDYRSLAGQLNGLASLPGVEAGKEYYWPAVANSALHTVTKLLYGNATPASIAMVDSLKTALANRFTSVSADVMARSEARGQAVAQAVFEWSKSDGGHEGYLKNFPTDYIPPTGPGMWVPTPRPTGPPQSALQPYWGKVRPFVLPAANPSISCDPGPPLAYSEEPGSPFYREAEEVFNAVKNLDDEKRAIAVFWADDPGATCTPPGHSLSILTQCIRMRGLALDRAAEAYAKIGIAVADAFISCWQIKYKYNLIRPISYIQKVIDPTWNTPVITDPVVTPPFPEYPSGHSVQSGAASRVLTGLFGENFPFTDHTHDAIGKPARSFTSFYQFADEAAISRLYGGIHFRAAIDRGVEQGKKIGNAVLALKFRK